MTSKLEIALVTAAVVFGTAGTAFAAGSGGGAGGAAGAGVGGAAHAGWPGAAGTSAINGLNATGSPGTVGSPLNFGKSDRVSRRWPGHDRIGLEQRHAGDFVHRHFPVEPEWHSQRRRLAQQRAGRRNQPLNARTISACLDNPVSNHGVCPFCRPAATLDFLKIVERSAHPADFACRCRPMQKTSGIFGAP